LIEELERKEIDHKEKVMTVRAEVYSRVVGYYRPIQDWNEGKREEFKERRYLKIKEEKK
jgi:anaerobic ribonucleoside-triphosphate reductase